MLVYIGVELTKYTDYNMYPSLICLLVTDFGTFRENREIFLARAKCEGGRKSWT